MLKLIKNIFAGPGAIKGVIDLVDKAHFADSEKAAAILAALKATQGSALARRFIAMAVTGLWLYLALMASVVWKLDRAWAGFLLELLNMASTPFGLIIGFYFLKHITSSLNIKVPGAKKHPPEGG